MYRGSGLSYGPSLHAETRRYGLFQADRAASPEAHVEDALTAASATDSGISSVASERGKRGDSPYADFGKQRRLSATRTCSRQLTNRRQIPCHDPRRDGVALMNRILVLDACALVALLNNENGADVVADAYTQAEIGEATIVMNRANLLEVCYGKRSTGLGTWLSRFAPSLPSWPLLFQPQQRTAPDVIRAHVKR